MRFDHFMKNALYDPERGYYSKRIKTVGQQGDFSTTASLSPILGEILASYTKRYFKKTKIARNLIECGAGSGALAETILKNLSLWDRRRMNYHIVESSPKLRKQQKEALGNSVTWHSSLTSALNACKGEAFCFSNELVDAFPARVFRKDQQGWSELHLVKEGILSEQFAPIDDDFLPESYIFKHDFSIGQRVEVHESYQLWFQEQIPSLLKGCFLTIDYGDSYKNLYHRRPNGTMRAYAHHQRLEGYEVYQNPGHQDITCDVNFTDLIVWGEQCGLKTVEFVTQREFLLSHQKKGDLASNRLLAEGGAGSAFKVLIQERPDS